MQSHSQRLSKCRFAKSEFIWNMQQRVGISKYMGSKCTVEMARRAVGVLAALTGAVLPLVPKLLLPKLPHTERCSGVTSGAATAIAGVWKPLL